MATTRNATRQGSVPGEGNGRRTPAAPNGSSNAVVTGNLGTGNRSNAVTQPWCNAKCETNPVGGAGGSAQCARQFQNGNASVQ